MPTINGTPADDTLNGTSENDTINGFEGIDTIDGGDGDDVIDGGDGDDQITDGAGSDTVSGGLGEDTIYASVGAGNDSYDGGEGEFDIVYYSAALAGVAVDLSGTTDQVTSVGGGNSAGIGTDTLVNIEGIWGSEFGDTMTGDDLVNQLLGRGGNDALYGRGGNDHLAGGDGDDIVDGGLGFDRASYVSSTVGVNVSLAISGAQNTNQGIDTLIDIENLTGSLHDDVLTGNDGPNQMNGQAGNDQLFGGAGNDSLFDADGNDRMYGEAGNDALNGGIGDDYLNGGADNDTLSGGDGSDTVTYEGATVGVTVNAGFAGPQNTVGAGIDTLSGFEILVGSEYGDWLTAGAGYITIRGGDGNDTLVSSADGDRLLGEAGDDTFIGNAGNDDFFGGVGFDTVDYGAASGGVAAGSSGGGANGVDQLYDIERIIGSSFDDQLSWTAVMIGGVGNDVYTIRSGNQVVEAAGQGLDRVDAWNTDYALPDNVENLSLYFDPYAGASVQPHPTLIGVGNSQDNIITGSYGANQLSGLAGSDTLTGGSGIDTLTGGAGGDSFKDSAAGLNGDTITDFVFGDKIIISNASLAGFSFSLNGNTLTYTGGSLTLTGFTGHIQASAAAGGGVQLTIIPHDARNDFNGDGRSDILFRHDSGLVTDSLGTVSGGFTNNFPNFNTIVGNDWRIAGTGDFNGDGRDDVLWRHDSGLLTEWLGAANGDFSDNFANASANVAPSWKIAGTGDFNGDGRDDILFRHDSGIVTDWLGQANGSFAANFANASSSVVTSWKVIGTGDFNGDGRDDILFRHDSGLITEWLGQANGGFADNFANTGNGVDTSWHIAGIGDFNGDNRDDILWRHDSGLTTDWLANANGGFTANGGTFLSQVGTDWSVSDIGDYNGDGRDDILWRHDSGYITEWTGLSNGAFGDNGPNAAVQVNPSWHIQSPDLM